MMRQIAIFLVFLIILLVGCAQEKKEAESMPLPGTTEPVSETETQEPEAPEQLKPEKCESTISPEDITHIDLSIFTEGLKKTEDGFSFRVIPLDINNNTVPATGNVGLTVFSTKWWNNEIVKGKELYKKSVYLKKEEASPDCSSKEIFVSFDDIKKQQNYQYVKEDDPGYLRVEFKRSYSNAIYEIEYSPYEHQETILP